MSSIAEVYVDLALPEVDRVFHYSVPADLEVQVGQAVRVPFGRRSVFGIVVGLCGESAYPNLKDISAVLYDGETVITEEQLTLARLLADYYLCPLSLILRQMLPFRLDSNAWPKPQVKKLIVPVVDHLPEDLPARASKQREILSLVLRLGQVPQEEIDSVTALKQLIVKGYVRQITVPVNPEGAVTAVNQLVRPPELTVEQTKALESLTRALDKGDPSTWLLQGVTGSGKTEVYMQLIAAALERQQQCLMLVPEISLTPQMVARFQARFGNRIAVWHSGLTPRERFDEWRRIRNGSAQIVIGARSAIFVPLTRLGVIILDEEHDQSYQQDENPRYHTRVVAQLRQRTTGCLLLFGSATPSLETYRASELGKCQRLELKERVSDRPLPPVHVVNMREELRAGHKAPVSRRLEYAIERCLERQEQAIILLNRRGFANFLLCLDCGHVPYCSSCDISLTYHLSTNRLHCHYCGQQQPVLSVCPECGSDRLRTQGIGTERLEAYLQARFPAARIGRMDRDTTTGRNAHARILQAFGQGEYDILVGTQMIAKGLDFPRVTLVGVVGADSGLHVPDFRSAERTFQLLTQVAGRAGRGDSPGEVILQAFNTNHYALECARNHDYLGFYRREMQMRQQGFYPPLGYMISMLLTNEDERELIADAAFVAAKLTELMGATAQIIGPTPCTVSKLKNSFRWQIMIKAGERVKLRSVCKQVLELYYETRRRTQIMLDFNA